MTLPALATVSDALGYDLTVTPGALLRASTRVRTATGQQITEGTSTVTLRGPVTRLPQRPVTAITSVVDSDGEDVEYTLNGSQLTARSTDLLTVEYDHGYAAGEIPDELVEVVCTIAQRLSTVVDTALASGVQQEQSGSASQTFGWDAWKALSSLTTEEKAVLKRLFPSLGGIVVQRS